MAGKTFTSTWLPSLTCEFQFSRCESFGWNSTTTGGPYRMMTVSVLSVQHMTDELVRGLAPAWHPTRVARSMRDGIGIAHTRANRTSRTEMLRMYCYASLESYWRIEVVEVWRWMTLKSVYTCIACPLKDGERFLTTTSMWQSLQ